MKKVTAYACDHCGRIYKTSRGCNWHEKRCYKNDDFRTCWTCRSKEYDCGYCKNPECVSEHKTSTNTAEDAKYNAVAHNECGNNCKHWKRQP